MPPKAPLLFSQMRPSNRRLLQLLLLITLVLGAFEGMYGRVRYSADAINYLNIVRAIHAHDWKLALNPYWGVGYSLLIAAATPLFPANPTGEWLAIHFLNLLIFGATFLSFYWLVWTAARSKALQWMVADPGSERFLLIGAYAIFLAIELSLDNVSRVGPDMLVSCLIFAACALLLKLQESTVPGKVIWLTAALGVVLGSGYVVKTIFLPMILVFALVVILLFWKKRQFLPSVVVMLFFASGLRLPILPGCRGPRAISPMVNRAR